jgi:hypothetical protein
MGSALTEHVRQLAASSDALEGFEDFWKVFGSLVRRQLKRRGLWPGPTRYLGVAGAGNWTDGDAFDELRNECYRFAILDRLPGLLRYVAGSASVEHAIQRNIANCFTELQRRNDPVGYAAYRNTEAAVEILLDEGVLTATRLRGTRIHNETVLSFGGVDQGLRPVTRQELARALANSPAWAELLPRLVRCALRVQTALAGCLNKLADTESRRFRFRDLAATVKQETRDYWARLHALPARDLGYEESDGLVKEVVPLVLPDDSMEDRETLASIVACLDKRIAGIRQKRVRQRVEAIVRELLDSSRDTRDIPSLAELARRLDVSTSTLHDSVKILREIAEDCRARESRMIGDKPG